MSPKINLIIFRPREVKIIFISIHPTRKITRFHFNISDHYLTIRDLKDQIKLLIKVQAENVKYFLNLILKIPYFL
jgi:hypothetical protein